MIITKLKINSFGGLAGEELHFSPGLNVIIGPNEAGKSTAFNAIQKVLLISSRLNRVPFQRGIESFIPIGGDTAGVELHFEQKGEPYVLKKMWGGTEAAELRLPDGSLITDDTAINERLESLLPATKATVQTVLMTYQTGLERTLADLEEDADAVRTLSDLLRRAVMEADGIAVEDFREAVREMRDSYFSRWDSLTGGPEAGRDINNPWKQVVGTILKAFYEKEEAASRLEKAMNYERELDRINGEIGDLVANIKEKDTFINANEKVVNDTRKRGTLEVRKEMLKFSIERIGEVNSNWPVCESDLKRIDEERPGVQARLKELEEEMELAQKAEDGKRIRDKLRRVNSKKEVVEVKVRELAQTKQLTSEELEDIRSASEALKIAKAGMSAGKLAVVFRAKRAIRLEVITDMEPSHVHELDKGSELPVDAGGRIIIEHEDWSMEVISGEIDFDKLQEKCGEAEVALSALLEEHAVGSLEEAIRVNSVYEEASHRLGAAEVSLEEELDGEAYEDLEASAEELSVTGGVRTAAEIAEDIANKKNEIEKKKVARKEKQEQVEGYKKEYSTTNDLLLRLADETKEQKNVDGQLESLAPLPDGYDTADKFITSFGEAKRERDEAADLRLELVDERAGLQKIDESSEELKVLLEDANARFEATRRKGEAIARIADLTENILEESDTDIYQGLESDLEGYVATITENRYREVTMDEGLPQGFERDDGEILFYNLLSHGTKDVLGLALRLSMANHFLKDANGFLVMDDPLVNLDPKRQEKAAELIKKYALDKQVLVFTCHPTHAEMLDGNLIEM